MQISQQQRLQLLPFTLTYIFNSVRVIRSRQTELTHNTYYENKNAQKTKNTR